MENYEINDETLIILSLDNNSSKVIEENAEYYINASSYEVMDNSCQYFGSSYEGRIVGSKSVLSSNYKLPILVEETKKIVFFPTASVSSNKCVWISLNKIKEYERYTNNNTLVTFKNNKQMYLNISFPSFENQLLRATRLNLIFEQRTKL